MKALASDMDGTLVFNGAIKQEDLKAIQAFQLQGHLFGICTGRGAVMCKEAKQFRCDFMIASSGAHILVNNETIYDLPIDFSIVKSIYNSFEQYTDFIIIQAKNSAYISKMHSTSLVEIDDLEKLRNEKIYDISLIFENETITRQVLEQIKASYPTLVGHQNGASIDIVDYRCSKGNAIKKLKELYSIDMIGGIGDSYNDISMIQEADYGFTFDNSPEIVKKDATYIVSGVAEALEILANK